jgi:pyruvate,water dikinase
LAVVVQKMINSEISGIMFTVDPNSEMPHIIIGAVMVSARRWWVER